MAFGSPDDEVIGNVGGRKSEKSSDLTRGFGSADDEIVKSLWTPAAIQEPTPAPAPPSLPKETLIGSGIEGLKGGLRTVGARALHAIGAPEWAGEVEKQAEENYARQATRPLAEIEENPWTWNSAKGIYEQAVASLPSMAPVLAGGLAGAKMGAVLGPWGALGGSLIGGTAGAMPQLVGSNLKRAIEEQKIPLKDTDLAGATGYALAQASLDSLLGGGLFGGAFKVPASIAANVVSRMAAKAIQGGLTEGLTEAAQQWLEIMYANPEKAKAMPPEVIKEIRDSGIVGGAMGLFGGGASGIKKPQADPSPTADDPYGPPAPPPGPNPTQPVGPFPEVPPSNFNPTFSPWWEDRPAPGPNPTSSENWQDQPINPTFSGNWRNTPPDEVNPTYSPNWDATSETIPPTGPNPTFPGGPVAPSPIHPPGWVNNEPPVNPTSSPNWNTPPNPTYSPYWRAPSAPTTPPPNPTYSPNWTDTPPGGTPPPGPSGPAGGPSGPAGPQAPPPPAPPPAAPVAPPAAPPTPRAPAGKKDNTGQQVFDHIAEQLRAVSQQEIAAGQKASANPIQINAMAKIWRDRYETLARLKGTTAFDEYRLENLSVQYGGDPNAQPEVAAPSPKKFLKKPTVAPTVGPDTAPELSKTQFFNNEILRLQKKGVKDPVTEATKTTEAKYPTKATSAPAQTSYPAKRSSENDNSYYDRVVVEAYNKGMPLPEAKKFAEAATDHHWPRTTFKQDQIVSGQPMAGHYSAIKSALDRIPMKMGTGLQWLKRLRQNGVKDEELEWTGYGEFLNSNKYKPISHTDARKAFRNYNVAVFESKPTPDKKNHYGSWTLGSYGTDPRSDYREVVLSDDMQPSDTYQSGHYKMVSNPIVHYRATAGDRATLDGKSVFMVEEIQSDWHQTGAKKGYSSPEAVERADAKVMAATRALGLAARKLFPAMDSKTFARMLNNGIETGVLPDSLTREMLALKAAKKERDQALTAPAHGPFKQTWPNLAFRQALMDAIKEGREYIAWPTGEQSDRHYAGAGGDRLKGMKAFYDVRLVDYAKKLGKPYGAKVEYIKIPGPPKGEEIRWSEHGGTVTIKRGNETASFDTDLRSDMDRMAESYGNDFVDAYLAGGSTGTFRPAASTTPTTYTVHGMKITPMMRELITAGGLPLFQKPAENIVNAEIELLPNSAIIRMYKSANVSSFMHESSHLWLRSMVKNAPFHTQIANDVEIIREWTGNKGEPFTAAQHEKFARGFELFLYSGRGPTAALTKIFKQFATWLKGVYAKASDIRTPDGKSIEVPEHIMQVYERMFSVDEKTAADGRTSYSLNADPLPINGVAEKFSQDKEGKNVNIQGGFSTAEALNVLGMTMYSDRIDQVSAKELVQNSFDAIKAAQKNKTLNGRGKVEIFANKATNTLTIKDNGIGMSTPTVTKAFFTVFGTEKKGLSPQESSGGYGLAKIAFLLGSKEIYVKTTHNGVTTEVRSNPEAIKNMLTNNVPIQARVSNTPDRPNGTVVQVTFPSEKKNKDGTKTPFQMFGGYSRPNILGSKFVGNFDIYNSDTKENNPDEMRSNDYDKSSATEMDKFLPPKQMNFPWGKIELYLGKDMQKYGGSVAVNSAGMPQFNWNVRDVGGKSPVIDAIVNVLPNNRPVQDVTAEDSRSGGDVYPFRTDRENWAPQIAKDVGNISQAIMAESNRRSIAEDVKKMSSLMEMPYTSLGSSTSGKWKEMQSTVTEAMMGEGKFASDTAELNPSNPYFHSNLNIDVIERAKEKSGTDPKKAQEFFAKFGSIVKDFAFTLGRVASEGGEKNFAAFVSGDKRIVGVSLDKEYRGVSTRVPFNGFFINPLALERAGTVAGGRTTSPRGIAAKWYALMIHEASHEIERNHGASFASQEIDLASAIGDLPGPDVMRGHLDDLEALVFSYRKEITALTDAYYEPNTENYTASLGDTNTWSGLEKDTGRGYGVNDNGVGNEPDAGQQEGNKGVRSLENQARESEDTGGMESPATESITLQQAAQQTPGQNPTSIYAINKASWKQNVKRKVEKFFNPFSEISNPEQYRDLRNLLGGSQYAATEQGTKYKNLFAKLTPAQKESVNTYFDTPNADTNLIPSSIRADTIRLKNYINGELKQKLIDNNLLPENVAEKNVDSYLPRLYLKYLLDASGTKGSGIKANLSWAKKRSSKSPEELLAMGEIKDPGVRTFHAIYRTQRDLAVMDFLNKVSNNSDWALPQSLVTWNGKRVTADWLKREAEDIRTDRIIGEPDPTRKAGMLAIADDMDRVANEGIVALNRTNYDQSKYTKLPDSYDYGPLRGMIVQKQIAEDIIGTNNFVNPDNTWDNWFGDRGSKISRLTSLWKTFKVPLNPPSQMRNVASNMILLHLSGVPIHKLGTYMVRSATDMRAGGKYFKIAKEFGVGNASMTEQELFAISEELQKLEVNKQNGFAGWRAVYRGLLKGANSVTDFYQKLETWGKIAKIMHAMETKTKEHPNGMSAEQAVREANKWLFDYSEVDPFVRRARQSPIGMPFLTFSYKVIPLMYEVMTKHPTRMLPYVALAATVPALVASSNDIDEDDEEKIRKSLSPGLRRKDNMFMLPWKDANGKWQLVDVGYFLPWQMPYEMAKSTAKAGYNLATGDSKEAISNAGDVFKASTLLSNPLFNIVSAMTTGVDAFTGKPIVDKRDPTNKQVMDVVSYAWSLVAPSFLASYGALGQLMNKESGTGLNRYGEPGTTYGQMAARAVGINTYSVDPAAQRARNIRMMQHDLREVKSRMTTSLSDRSLTPEQRRKVTEDFREELIYRNQQLAKYAKETEMSPRLREATARP